jgi:hypothetical protein
MTGRWLFRGERQPLPFRNEDRLKLKHILLDLLFSASREVQARYRYLDAVLTWLTTDEVGARVSFRLLASETEYVEVGRVLKRHVIADELGKPILFDGTIEKHVSDKRWVIFIESLSRRVDFVESDSDRSKVEIGRPLRGFSVAFNYRGPVADFYSNGSRRR